MDNTVDRLRKPVEIYAGDEVHKVAMKEYAGAQHLLVVYDTNRKELYIDVNMCNSDFLSFVFTLMQAYGTTGCSFMTVEKQLEWITHLNNVDMDNKDSFVDLLKVVEHE